MYITAVIRRSTSSSCLASHNDPSHNHPQFLLILFFDHVSFRKSLKVYLHSLAISHIAPNQVHTAKGLYVWSCHSLCPWPTCVAPEMDGCISLLTCAASLQLSSCIMWWLPAVWGRCSFPSRAFTTRWRSRDKPSLGSLRTNSARRWGRGGEVVGQCVWCGSGCGVLWGTDLVCVCTLICKGCLQHCVWRMIKFA